MVLKITSLQGCSHSFEDGDDSLPTLVLIPGYCQSGEETWGNTVYQLRQLGLNNPIVVINRYHGELAGRQTPNEQLEVLRHYISWLCTHVLVGRRLIWGGHSFGGYLADALSLLFPQQTEGVITINQVSTTGWWIFFCWSFWRHGGLISLPAVLWSLLTGRSVRFPEAMVTSLFTNVYSEPERLERFKRSQQPDSAWLFVQMLFFYWMPEQMLEHLMYLGRSGRKVIIHTSGDRLISRASLQWLAWRTETPLRVTTGPHCWWLDGTNAVAHQLQKAVDQIGSV